VTATFLVALYYNILVAWALWFLANSFQSPLPWADTPSTAATNASSLNSTDLSHTDDGPPDAAARNASSWSWCAANATAAEREQARAVSFFEVDTLHCRPDNATTCSWGDVTEWGGVFPALFDTGGLVGPLVLCLAVGWFLIWLCVCQGIESLGKVAWFTAIFPYIVLAIFLVRGLTLPGAHIGLTFYLTPDFSQLSNPEVWLRAASQIFYSTGVGWGTLVAFASYNEHSHNFVRDAWLVPLINCATSFLAGLVVFSVVGYMAQSAGIEIADMQLAGPELAFVAYPQAIAQMPGAPFFSVLFFLMVICLGVDSQFAMVETVLTSLNDAGVMPGLSKPQKSAVVCFAMGCLGLLFVTRAGMHWLELFDTFAGNMTLFLCGALECIAIGWVYGAERFAADTLSMTGRTLPKGLLILYKWLIPFVLFLLALIQLLMSTQNAYDFPPAGIAFGWLLILTSTFPIAYFAIQHCRQSPPRRFLTLVRPNRAAPSAMMKPGPKVEVTLCDVQLSGSPHLHISSDATEAASPAHSGMVAGAGGTPQRGAV